MVEKVQEHLLTPYGSAQSRAERSAVSRGRYTGGPAERDGAYHQGTVWPWLIGPFITAYVKVNGGSDAPAHRRPNGSAVGTTLQMAGWTHLRDLRRRRPNGLGGCMAQAWSVAEILRAYVEDVKGLTPNAGQVDLATSSKDCL